MAVQTKFRRATATAWASANPVLASGEPGLDLTNNILKIGNGSTAWNSLAAFGAQGDSGNSMIRRSYGDGSWGDITIGTGQQVTLDQDAYYNNLTLTGSGKLVTMGFKIFVRNLLDLRLAETGAISANGANGNNASGATQGAAPLTVSTGSLGVGSTGGAGAVGSLTTGAQGGAAGAITGNGGSGGGGGAGGTSGTAVAGGTARTAANPTSFSIRRFESNWLRGASLIGAGAGGAGGSSGGGDGANLSGAGGSGANGGGFVCIHARVIARSANSPIGIIQANGGNGGNGGDATGGSSGGGSGGGGGGGGYVVVFYETLVGRKAQEFIQANGGMGGTGGAGASTGIGGAGAGAGAGGRVFIYNTLLARGIEVFGSVSATGYAALLAQPGSGGLPGLCEVDF